MTTNNQKQQPTVTQKIGKFQSPSIPHSMTLPKVHPPICVLSPADETKQSFAVGFLLGGLPAAVAKTTVAPIERVKLLMQNQGALIENRRLSEPLRYQGMRDCFSRIYKSEGFFSLWRGNTANVIRCFPNEALNLYFNGYFKKFFNLKKYKENSDYWMWFAGHMASGGAAGASSLLFVYHLDYSRTRMANDIFLRKSKAGEFSGLIDLYRKTLSSDGVAGLYRGFVPSCLGAILYRTVYFGLYDSLKPLVLSESMQDTFIPSFGLSWMTSMVAAYTAYPMDTISRRMMMTSGNPLKYKHLFEAFYQIVRDEGPRSLFKGANVNVFRAVVAAAVLAGYDKVQLSVLGKKYGSHAREEGSTDMMLSSPNRWGANLLCF